MSNWSADKREYCTVQTRCTVLYCTVYSMEQYTGWYCTAYSVMEYMGWGCSTVAGFVLCTVLWSTLGETGQPTKESTVLYCQQWNGVHGLGVYSTGYSGDFLDCTQLYSCIVYRLSTVVHHTEVPSCH